MNTNAKKLLAVLLLNSVVFGGGAVFYYNQYRKNIYYSNSVLILPNGSQTIIVPSAQLDAGARFKSKSTLAVRQDVSYTPTVSVPLSDVEPKGASAGAVTGTLSSTVYAYNGGTASANSRNRFTVGSGGGASVGTPLLGSRQVASTQLTAFSNNNLSSKTVLSNTSTPVNAPNITTGTNNDEIIDPQTDPTTPPIPVGDGVVVLLILSIAYAGVWKRERK